MRCDKRVYTVGLYIRAPGRENVEVPDKGKTAVSLGKGKVERSSSTDRGKYKET